MKTRRLAALIAVLVATNGPGFGQDFNVDVGAVGSQPPPSSYAAAGRAGTWNSVTAEHVTPFTTGPHPQDVFLVDRQGNQTSVGFHQFGGMDMVTTNDPSVTGHDATLLNDYLATHNAVLENCMYLNGLIDGTYEVLTYAWMPNSPSTLQNVRFDFNPGSTLVGGSWGGSHVEGITYSRDIIEVSGGFMGFHSGIPSGGATQPGAAFNGFQVRRLGAPVRATSLWKTGVLASFLLALGALLLGRRRPAVR